MADDANDAESHRLVSSPRRVALYTSAIVSALFMVRLLGAGWSTHFLAVWPDAVDPKQGYLAVAGTGPFRPSFYFAFRPIGYPLFLWALRRDALVTVVAQTALYCAVVGALCFAAFRVLHSRVVAGITALAFVGIAVQAKYAMWNTQILSESLAISLGFASIAAWWRFAATPTRARARWGWGFVIAWLLVRDANVLPATIVIVPVALAVAGLSRSLDRGIRRTLAVGAVFVMVTAGYSYFSASASHRAELSFHDVVGIRVLPDPVLTKWFTAHGMPLDRALRTRTGKGGLVDNFYLSKDPAFAKYRHWARGAGPRALVLSLVVLAPRYARLMNKDLPAILDGNVQAYDTQGAYDRLPRQIPLQLGGPTTRDGLVLWLTIAIAGTVTSAVLALRRKRGMGVVVFSVAALALTLIEGYTTWGGDPVELERHMIGALSRLSVILVIIIASSVDAALRGAGATPAREPAGTQASA
ncbi:MAG: hypothetical protein ACLPVY_18815 [Acidimicrobiia bacterium]